MALLFSILVGAAIMLLMPPAKVDNAIIKIRPEYAESPKKIRAIHRLPKTIVRETKKEVPTVNTSAVEQTCFL